MVWDLRGKREVVALAYGGGAGTHMVNAGAGMAVGGRRGMSDIAWHPDNVGHYFLLAYEVLNPDCPRPQGLLLRLKTTLLPLSWSGICVMREPRRRYEEQYQCVLLSFNL